MTNFVYSCTTAWNFHISPFLSMILILDMLMEQLTDMALVPYIFNYSVLLTHFAEHICYKTFIEIRGLEDNCAYGLRTGFNSSHHNSGIIVLNP